MTRFAFVAFALFVVGCGGSKPPAEKPDPVEMVDAAPADPVDPPPDESKLQPPPDEEKPVEPPPPPETFADLKEEDPKNVLYDEIVAANMAKGYRLRVTIRKDSTWTVTTPTESKDGKLDAKQKKSFDKALKSADVKGELPKGGTCAGLPSSNIEIRAKGKVATYADQCAAEPTKSLAALTALVHGFVGLDAAP
jgi:hypothetical protein